MKEFKAVKIRDTAEEKVDVSNEFMEKFLPFQEPVRLILGHGAADVTGYMSFCKMSPTRVSVEVIVSGNSAIRFEITPADVPKIMRTKISDQSIDMFEKITRTKISDPSIKISDPPIDVFEWKRVYNYEFDTDKLKQGSVYLISSKSSKVLAYLNKVSVNRILITVIGSVEIITISEVNLNSRTITAESAYNMGLTFEEVCYLDSLDGNLE